MRARIWLTVNDIAIRVATAARRVAVYSARRALERTGIEVADPDDGWWS